MRTIKKEFKVYNFNELEKDIQEKLLQDYIESAYESYCNANLYDDVLDNASDILQTYFKNAELNDVCYDLSYSQGNGVVIEFNIDLEDINNIYHILSKRAMQKINEIGYTNIKVKQQGYYYHEHSYNLDYQDYTYYIDDFENEQKQLDNLMEQFEKDIVNMNKDITKKGFELIENREYFEEQARTTLNELEFLEDGGVFNE